MSNVVFCFVKSSKTKAEFSKFLDRCPERFQIRLPALTDNKGQLSSYLLMFLMFFDSLVPSF